MIIYDTFRVGHGKVELRFDNMGGRYILYDGKKFEDLSSLFAAVPELKSGTLNDTAARIINFVIQGNAFEVVVDIAKFKEEYKARVAREKDVRDIETFRTRSYGVYDVSRMASPAWEGNVMHFFAVSTATGVPYEVNYKPPMDGQNGECSYRLLPFSSV